MNREAQRETNTWACHRWAEAMDEWLHEYDDIKSKKLRSCSAVVYETSNYYILQSYDTPVAVIIKSTNTLVDMLRHVYMFTRTSAQHIYKFRHDYTPYPWNYPVIIWRELK